ncbi:hypothetical protein BBO99_00007536 [Phytophthora kernoviae]|uniref:Transmembrane protein n=1 Tax=Phytophthora kernoviae TaxID=325452 RepID=A0A3R7JQT2_9STRA|nr:hypothetical protein BBI17_007473 [Phytophthora kernoviae]RLN76457.1 hypothetical protein BBO99_00007536 [Phytophthora kernoviae]
MTATAEERDYSMQVPSTSYVRVSTPRLPSSTTNSRSVNLRRRKVEIEIVEGAPKGPTWQFPGSGSSEHVQVPLGELAEIQKELDKPRKLLSELPATAICGNDILSSVLYTASSVASKSGKLMPIPLIMVSIVLFFFRFIYEEVVTAIPMNGGTYNALLNTTSKRTAAFAACLSILSYLATGVVSATNGVRYLDKQVDIPIMGCTIILLGVFALLAVSGISESSRVAVVIFLHHIIVLSILFVASVVYGIQHSHIFRENMHTGFPQVDFAGSMLDGNVFTAIFFGFGASMLGITGFESSSNYVEEQAPGVFRKTLRNMWALVTIFNIGLGAAILAVLPLADMYANSSALLAKVGEVAVGHWFEVWVCIDAFVVLSGAVLTSYVGICGLVRRLSTDRVLPAFLAKTNKARGTNHYIIGIYFLLSSSLVLILNADAATVNGVYTYAFLGLMALFSCACMLLKGKRSEIPRDAYAPWVVVILGFLLVVVAIFANLLGDPSVLMYFALYFIVVELVMFVMLERVTILRCALAFLKKVAPSRYGKAAAIGLATHRSGEVEHTGARGGHTIARVIASIQSAPIIFFCKTPDLTILNKAIIYVRRNEQTQTLRIVHVFADEEEGDPVYAAFREMAALFDSMYPKIRVDFVSVQGEFGPAMIEWLSRKMGVPRNMMFITQPDFLSAERVSTAGIEIEVVDSAPKGPTWQFPGFGTSEHVQVPEGELAELQSELSKPHNLLGELSATAICGNDILSSVLYSASSVAAKSGKLMPIPLVLVASVLYFFRFIYEEVVTAIPMNGGTYNALLNTTSKRTAAFAACLSILSYVATGVVSATSGVRYLNNQVDIPIVGCTIILLGAFALLAVMGISESSRVAVVIFLHQIIVLSILFVASVVYGIQHSHIFSDNMHTSLPEVDFGGSMLDGNVFTAIFFGFGASMLGITGFESSSNYVEEQAPGIFRKTLRNMWALVTFFNIGLGAGILAVLPLDGDDGIYAHDDALLAKVAQVSVGHWLEVWVCIDAFVVLCGAVLTSYIGICGLVLRLANDRVLPAFLAKKNKTRGTNHYIIGIYFFLSSSLVLILNADATTVNGVYTYAFLGLMALFSCACMLLKGKRSEIPRDIHAPWPSVVIGFLLVVIGIFSNLLGDPKVLMYFAIYFIVVMLAMFIMFERVTILRYILVLLQYIAPSRMGKQTITGMTEDGTPEVEHTGARGGRTIARTIVSIRDAPIVFFCKVPDLTIINKAIIYVRRNEQTHTLRIVHVFSDEEADTPVLTAFREMVTLFDSMYPKIRVDFVSVQGEFSPAMIEWLSRSMKVPRNMMFITQPDFLSAERVSSAGVRVITA